MPSGAADKAVEGDGVSWTVVRTGDKTLRVTQRDAGQGGRAVAEGTVDAGLPSAGQTSPVAIGKDVFIVVGSSNYDPATKKNTSASKIFKASAI